MKIEAVLVKAFTQDKNAGNPAGVVINASGLSSAQMQYVAADLGYSESAFVLPSKTADYQVRFFTPKQEVDYCGHATVATFYSLFNLSENANKTTLTQDTKAGLFTITRLPDGKIMMKQKDAVFGSIMQYNTQLTNILGIQPSDLHEKFPTQIVQNNVFELIIPCKSIEVLRTIKPDLEALVQFTSDKPYHGVYCFAESDNSINALYARSFAPSVGISEDPATGVAAGPLACYADKYIYKGKKKQIKINQGMWMGKSSELYVDLISGVEVSGFAATFGTKAYDWS